MGHDNIKVLDGGLPDWIEAGMDTVKTSELKVDYPIGYFKSDLQADNIIFYEDVMDNNTTRAFKIVDARSEGRFNGVDPEPRAHLQSGCIPNSINIPYTAVLANGKFKSKEELQVIFDNQLNTNETIVYSCGSGLTACIVLLASHLAFNDSMKLYDGSWTEYAERNNLTTSVS
jgi:thiosulfate/3-mercaptopyruvate sulfurtransferase